MSSICFSFRPDAIPAYAQAEFLTRFCQLVLDYQTLTEPVQPSPPAESLPQPSAFVPVDGDETTGPQAQKKERKNPWAGLSEEQRAERLAAMKRGRELKKQEKRRPSEDSLEIPVAPAPVVAAPVVTEDAVSESSSKQRKNPWADLTPEQKAERVAKMNAARKAKKEAASQVAEK